MVAKIDDLEKIICRDCKSVLVDVLKNKDIGFEKERIRPQRDLFWLNGNNISRASAGERAYHVIPFLPLSNGITYWLAVGVQVDIIKGVYKFRDASILIFEGTALDESKTPILRAEWGLSENGLHAQPHWHVYPSYINKEITPFIDSSKVETSIFTPEQTTEDDSDTTHFLSKFHFAMEARWHLNNREHVIEFTESGLVNWLRGCLEYTKSQLSYMMKE